ncbi:tetratricopeptide repeat protein [Comamonas sp. J-3]|uniref:tetratricopeptide repeat protein n=1 Tax=Comamonas trifloxystrobinivorans TaxID=3350256 RepID=UPI0037285D54
MHRHHTPHLARRCAPAWAASLCILLLSACASKSPQGYGVAEPSTAQQAQQQMEKAEQSTQLDAQQTYLNLIAQMQQANQWYASLAHTEAFERQYGNTPQLRLMRADAQRNTAQTQAAQSSYESLLADSNSSVAARAHRGLGLLLAGQGQLPAAVAQLEKARSLNPIDADVLSDLAYAHMLQGDLPGAQIPIMQASQLAPSNARVQLNLALYWLANGSHNQAAQLLQRLQQPASKNAAPLIDQNSVRTLQSQLAAVQQALARKQGANTLPAVPTVPAAATPQPAPANADIGSAPAAPDTATAPASPTLPLAASASANSPAQP